jgi:hypothetical protein
MRSFLVPFALFGVACGDYTIMRDGVESDDDDDAGLGPVDSIEDLADECEPIAWIRCGESVVGDSGDPEFGRSDSIDFWPVAVGNYEGPEVAYAWEVDRTGTVEWRLVGARPTRVNHDLFVLDGDAACRADTAIDWGHNDVRFRAEIGEVRVLVLDGFDLDTGEYEVRLDCD